MNSLNKVIIIGNLTRDPDLKTTASGQPLATVGVATNRYWTDSNGQKKDEAEFHNIVMWGRLAEIAHRFLKKGMKVYFEGRLQTRSWEDEAGNKHFRTEVVARDMMILSPRDSSGAPIDEDAIAEISEDDTPSAPTDDRLDDGESGEMSLEGTEI